MIRKPRFLSGFTLLAVVLLLGCPSGVDPIGNSNVNSDGNENVNSEGNGNANASSNGNVNVNGAANDNGSTSANALPDFSLPDINPASARASQSISPRDYLGQVSAWYFGHST